MGWYDDWADEMEELERKKDRLLKELDDREIGITGRAEVLKDIAEIDKKLGK